MGVKRVLNGKGLVEGQCNSKILFVERLNIYGDIDPVTGLHRGLGVEVKDKVLAVKAVVGSTVAPYIAYSLARRGLAPCALIASAPVDPVTVAAAVLGGFALAEVPGVERDLDGCKAIVAVEPPRARVEVEC